MTACGTTPSSHVPDIPASQASTSFTWQNPFIPYGITEQQQRTIEHALAKLLGRCVATYGLALPPRMTITVNPLVAETTSSASVADWLSIRQSQEDSYLPTPSSGAQGQLQPLDGPWQISFALPRNQGKIFNDLSSILRGKTSVFDNKPVPKGGCVQWSTETLDGQQGYFGDQAVASDPNALLLYLDEQALAATDSSNRVQKATAAWRSCMTEGGFRYSSPLAAESDPRWMSYASTGASRQELIKKEAPVAYADARCRYLTHYSSIRAAVFSDYADRSLVTHAGQIHGYQKELLRMIRTATSLAANKK